MSIKKNIGRKAIAAAIALGFAASLVPAGAQAAAPTTVINVGSLYEPQNLDNTAGGGQGVTEALNGNVYEGLFKLNDDGSVSNLLATSYTSTPDGLTYTFKLRSGVKFASGKPLTSADVKFSIQKVIATASLSARKSSFGPISSITTPDASTVVIALSARSIFNGASKEVADRAA